MAEVRANHQKRRSKWADISEDEWSSEEETPQETPTPTTPGLPSFDPSEQVTQLQTEIQSSSPPYRFFVKNLPFSLSSENELLEFFAVSEEDKTNIKVMFPRENSSHRNPSNATLLVYHFDLAMKISERNEAELRGRPVQITLKSREDSRGLRGRGRGNRAPRTPRGPRGMRGRRRPEPPRTAQHTYRKSNNFEQARKSSEKTITPGIPAQSISIPSAQPKPAELKPVKPKKVETKPKPDPFGGAKPVDTLSKDLEFETKLKKEHEETKKPETQKSETQKPETQKPETQKPETQKRYVKKNPEEPHQRKNSEPAWKDPSETAKVLTKQPTEVPRSRTSTKNYTAKKFRRSDNLS